MTTGSDGQRDRATRRPWLGANFKMNGGLELLGRYAATRLPSSAEIVIFPSFPFLAAASAQLHAVSTGSQDLSTHESGAYTGEVSATQVFESGARWALIGHSERRQRHGESDLVVAMKLERAIAQGLRPVLCVGETLAEREAGRGEAVVLEQLRAVWDRLGIEVLNSAVIAYEPVWAIGTGRAASAEQAQQMHALIRAALAGQRANLAGSVRIVYGGSLKADNAAELFAMPDIDGGLIGGAALDPAHFTAIAEALVAPQS